MDRSPAGCSPGGCKSWKKKEQLGVRELVNSLLGAHTEHQPSAQWASEQAYICGLGDKW